MRNLSLVLLMAVAFGVSPAGDARAQETCPFDDGTILGLRHCVEHAVDMGFITNDGVALSLLVKIDVAQYAFERGSTRVAVLLIKVFILEVTAQAGRAIDAQHAEH